MTTQTPEPGPPTDVRVGMPVFDSDAEQLGTVAALKFGGVLSRKAVATTVLDPAGPGG